MAGWARCAASAPRRCSPERRGSGPPTTSPCPWPWRGARGSMSGTSRARNTSTFCPHTQQSTRQAPTPTHISTNISVSHHVNALLPHLPRATATPRSSRRCTSSPSSSPSPAAPSTTTASASSRSSPAPCSATTGCCP